MKSKVVIPCAPPASSLECIRSLGKNDIETITLSEGQISPEYLSKYRSEWINSPVANDNIYDYLQLLIEIAKTREPLTIYPIREIDIFVLSKYKEKLSQYISTPWPDFETVEKVQDRLKLLNIAQNTSIPVPRWDLASNWTESVPAVVKARYSIQQEGQGTFYGGTQFVEPKDEIDASALEKQMRHNPLVQEFIPGDEYGFFAIARNGNCLATFQHKRLRSISYTGGASTFRKSIYSERLQQLGKRLIEKLQWTGIAMIEFKKDSRDEKFKLMEINPRFWGSLPLAVRSGVNFPLLYYQFASKKDLSHDNCYKIGVKCQRTFEEFGYLESILNDSGPSYIQKPSFRQELLEVIKSIFLSESDYLSYDDPLPALWYAIETIRRFYHGRIN